MGCGRGGGGGVAPARRRRGVPQLLGKELGQAVSFGWSLGVLPATTRTTSSLLFPALLIFRPMPALQVGGQGGVDALSKGGGRPCRPHQLFLLIRGQPAPGPPPFCRRLPRRPGLAALSFLQAARGFGGREGGRRSGRLWLGGWLGLGGGWWWRLGTSSRLRGGRRRGARVRGGGASAGCRPILLLLLLLFQSLFLAVGGGFDGGLGKGEVGWGRSGVESGWAVCACGSLFSLCRLSPFPHLGR